VEWWSVPKPQFPSPSHGPLRRAEEAGRVHLKRSWLNPEQLPEAARCLSEICGGGLSQIGLSPRIRACLRAGARPRETGAFAKIRASCSRPSAPPVEDFIREVAREQQLGLWRTRKAGHEVSGPLNSRIRLAIRPRDKKGRRFFSGGSFRNLIENWRKNEVVRSICGGENQHRPGQSPIVRLWSHRPEPRLRRR
jgi:hypothetical protein